jgi:hypothetical protein
VKNRCESPIREMNLCPTRRQLYKKACIPVPVAPRMPHFFFKDGETIWRDMNEKRDVRMGMARPGKQKIFI